MDPLNRVKINYNFKKSLKGNVTRSRKLKAGPPPRGGTRNRKSLVNLTKKAI